MVDVLRYAAFTVDGEGGNPAGVVLDARGLDDEHMLSIAADVGYSETAFLLPRSDEPNVFDVRYFSPLAEVPFCGHATIASAVAIVERKPADDLIFHTQVGFVSINTKTTDRGLVAELTSVAPRVEDADPALVDGVLAALHWSRDDLDPDFPIKVANAGATHLILVTKTRERLAALDYDFDALQALMTEHDLITCAADLAGVEEALSLAEPVPARRCGRGSRHRGGRRRVRWLPARARQDRPDGEVPISKGSIWVGRASSTSRSSKANRASGSAGPPARSLSRNGYQLTCSGRPSS